MPKVRSEISRIQLDLNKKKDLLNKARRREYKPEVDSYRPKTAAEIENYISILFRILYRKGIQLNPMTYELFTTPKFFNSLPSITRQNPNIMLKLLEHNSRFQDLLRNRESFLGEEVNIGLNYHQDGRERVFESGRRINIDAIKEQGIDPRFILVYRVTQPSYVSKPEYYWTTDFFEVIHGLRREISLEHRKKSVILFSTLDQINKNGGLIMDVNDDNGLAVRQISNKPFNQNLCLSRVPTY